MPWIINTLIVFPVMNFRNSAVFPIYFFPISISKHPPLSINIQRPPITAAGLT